VHDDVRLLADATKEKDESHAGKVVERNWYQKNKHIFPASRWEVILLCFIESYVSHRLVERFSIRIRVMGSILLPKSTQ
jgi:hypothetical protein